MKSHTVYIICLRIFFAFHKFNHLDKITIDRMTTLVAEWFQVLTLNLLA